MPSLGASVRGVSNPSALTLSDFVAACVSNGSTLSNFGIARTSMPALSQYVTPPVHLTREGQTSSLANIESIISSSKTSEYQTLLQDSGLLLSVEHELNWSGRQPSKGQHVEFEIADDIPLEEICLLGCGAYGSVHKVKCRRIFLASQ